MAGPQDKTRVLIHARRGWPRPLSRLLREPRGKDGGRRGGGRERAPFQLCLNDITLPRIGELAWLRASGRNRIREAGSALGLGVGMLFDRQRDYLIVAVAKTKGHFGKQAKITTVTSGRADEIGRI